jgi:metal-dependent HD superfamily phosphatase/phosphodiesterase
VRILLGIMSVFIANILEGKTRVHYHLSNRRAHRISRKKIKKIRLRRGRTAPEVSTKVSFCRR